MPYRLIVTLAILLATSAAVVQAATRPNILFIFTDDQGPWAMTNADNPDADTPGMDRLAREGAKFSNFFVTTPVCSPSRVGLLASRYGSEVGITDWISPRGNKGRISEADLGLDPNIATWVRDLRDAGYNTGLVGKWHLGTQDKFLPKRFGYDYFYGFREGGARVIDPELEHNGVKAVEKGLTTDLLTDKALAFLQNAGEKDKPFMLSVHYRAPHAPWKPVAEADDAHLEGRELDLPDPDIPNLDHPRMDRIMREYLASVAGVDRNIRRMLKHLDESGRTKDTIVIFTSDHGYNVGHRGILHKGNGSWLTVKDTLPHGRRPNMFDTSMRVPAIVRWPGVVEAGSIVDTTVTNLDWFPTLLAMAGLNTKEGVLIHGRNFLPLLKGKSIPWEESFYGEYGMHHYETCDMRVFRTPEWKLLRDFKRTGKDELYHLATDPEEVHNLIDNPDHAAIQAELSLRITARHAEISATRVKNP
jgi:choline-sulfatase